MAKRARTPQEKKQLSLEHDRRNTYGQSNKASRKAIPAFKAASNRAARHEAARALEKVVVAAEQRSSRAERKLADVTWVGLHPSKSKSRDEPLGKVLSQKKEKRIASVNAKARRSATAEASKKVGQL